MCKDFCIACYATHQFISYNCNASNPIPCNTVNNLKRILTSTILPTNEEIQKFDTLIVPTVHFDSSLCLQISNMTNCPESNLDSRQQCINIIQYSETRDTCAVCLSGQAFMSLFNFYTIFLLNNRSQSDTITLACRRHGACNSVENIDKIKRTLITKFDSNKFYSATASGQNLTMDILLIIYVVKLIFCVRCR